MFFNDCTHHAGACPNGCENHPDNKAREKKSYDLTWKRINAAQALIDKIDALKLTELKEERDNLERTLWLVIAPCDLK